MKVLVVGDGHSPIHEVAAARALKELGHEVQTFFWASYIGSTNPLVRMLNKAQNKYLLGPLISKINRALLKTTKTWRPDLIFVYRGTHVQSKTLKKIRSILASVTIFGYNNDDPFAPGHQKRLWSLFKASLPSYDLMFAYRHHNIEQYLDKGAKKSELLRSWYLPWSNYPMQLDLPNDNEFSSDVVFAGHYENDGRLEILEDLVRDGYKLKIFGPPETWEGVLSRSEVLKHLLPVRQVWADEYNKALSGSKIALCFLSKLNRDTYTRRCFEIPATKSFLLSEYTDDLASLYKPGIEADYFRTREEAKEKIHYYLTNAEARSKITQNGFEAVRSNGHDVINRMAYVMGFVKK